MNYSDAAIVKQQNLSSHFRVSSHVGLEQQPNRVRLQCLNHRPINWPEAAASLIEEEDQVMLYDNI